MEEKKIYYVVLKMQKTVSYIDPITGRDVFVELTGCAGYIPVFSTEKEAKENSDGGRFNIVEVIV